MPSFYRLLSGQVCPENSCEIPTKSADFSAILSRKIPRNLTFFLRIIRSSVYVYPATWNFSDCHDDRYPSHIGSSQVDTLVPSQNPIFLNWHTNFVVLHFCEWQAPVMDTLFASQGCSLTGASTVSWTTKDQANALTTGFLQKRQRAKKVVSDSQGLWILQLG